jgi:succinate dehydrogenase/fumarate reductase cytochrome b subunit (b558 family)
MAAHFMATNPMIKVMEPVLAIGFIVHIIWSLIITLQNMRARPVGYNKTQQSVNSTWASRNMLILGAMLFVFMGLHLYHFWYKMKIAGDPLLAHITVMQGGVAVEMENAYALVSTFFKERVVYGIFYIRRLVGGPPCLARFLVGFPNHWSQQSDMEKEAVHFGQSHWVGLHLGFCIDTVVFHD